MAKAVCSNGLCDTLKGDHLERLVQMGVDTIETRLVWWEVEKSPGQWDFSEVEAEVAQIHRYGLRAGLFFWPQHPPDWFHGRSIPFRCLEHDTDSTILSIWDKRTLEAYDRFFEKARQELGPMIDWVTVGITGDFGEYAYPSGMKHYRFSPAHGHLGFWCGDVTARENFRTHLRGRHGTMDAVNALWGTRFGSWDDDLFGSDPLKEASPGRLGDIAAWYTGSLDLFANEVCGRFREHFPDVPGVLPVGFAHEKLTTGQVKSRPARLAGQYNLFCRWTGVGHFDEFSKGNVLTRRLSSASRAYGTRFATEASLVIDADRAVTCLYEALSNGTELIHDDPQNIFVAESVYRRLLGKLPSIHPQCSLAGFYPTQAELAGIAEVLPEDDLIRWYASLRGLVDMDFFDLGMLLDGLADAYEDLLLPPGSALPQEPGDALFRRSARQRIWLPETWPDDTIPLESLLRRESLAPGLYRYRPECPEQTGRYHSVGPEGELLLDLARSTIDFVPAEGDCT